VANQSMTPQSNRSRAVEVRQLIERCATEINIIYQDERATAAAAGSIKNVFIQQQLRDTRESLYANAYRLGALLRDWEEP
jgi:hypothetical protein